MWCARVAERQIRLVRVLETWVRVPFGDINKALNFAWIFEGWSRGFEPRAGQLLFADGGRQRCKRKWRDKGLKTRLWREENSFLRFET